MLAFSRFEKFEKDIEQDRSTCTPSKVPFRSFVDKATKMLGILSKEFERMVQYVEHVNTTTVQVRTSIRAPWTVEFERRQKYVPWSSY
jgi:hypothetical protein